MPARSTSTTRPPETPLLALIRQRIQDKGSISIAAYMDLALNHPDLGYYHHRQNPFGADGDFVTAPEISQMFGELLGLWLATAWQQAGRPTPFRLVELGPGRGQLMADLLRATAKVPGFVEGADIHLIESSKKLRDQQRMNLSTTTVTWHDRLETVPRGPLFLIANEFFDALPVHQLIRTETGFFERMLTWKDDVGLAFTEADAPEALLDIMPTLASRARSPRSAQTGTISPVRSARASRRKEVSPRSSIMAPLSISSPATRCRPFAITKSVDPLRLPGEVDLTTHVDFKSLAQAAASAGADVFGPVPQGAFLRTLGIGHPNGDIAEKRR